MECPYVRDNFYGIFTTLSNSMPYQNQNIPVVAPKKMTIFIDLFMILCFNWKYYCNGYDSRFVASFYTSFL